MHQTVMDNIADRTMTLDEMELQVLLWILEKGRLVYKGEVRKKRLMN